MYSYMTKKQLAEQVRSIKNKKFVMHETLCKKSKDDTNNTGLQREANMAAENINSRPDEEDYDRDISTSTENDNIMMNDITAQEGRENRLEILQRILKLRALLVIQQLKNRDNSIQTQI